MKKFISLVLALLTTLTLGCMAACKTNGKTSESSSSNEIQGEETHGLVETGKYIVENGKSDYKIVIPASAGRKLLWASEEMQYFLEESLDVKLDVIYDAGLTFSSRDKYISIGENALSQAAGVTCDKEEYGSSGYVIRTVGQSVFLVGGDVMGSLYAVYDYLNQTLNFESYSVDEVYIDETDKLPLHKFNYSYIPSFEFRSATFAYTSWWHYDESQRFYDQMNYIDDPTSSHSFFMFFPLEQYKETHPEWYNSSFTQCCLSAEGLPEALAEKFIELLIENPEDTCEGRNTLMFGMNDLTDWCYCPDCSALASKYGTNSAVQIIFINKVADMVQAWIDVHQPGRKVLFSIYAYYSTVAPPVSYDEYGNVIIPDDEIICRPNVAVRYAPIDAAFNYSLGDKEHNLTTYNQIRGWAAICQNIIMYSYGANYRHGFMGLDNFNAVQDSYRFLEEHNVMTLGEQGITYAVGSPNFRDFRTYMHAKLAWNTNYNLEELKVNFFTHYYKNASEWVLKYFDELRIHHNMLAEKYGVQGTVYEEVYREEYWSQGLLEKWLGYFENAYKALEPLKATDPDLYEEIYDRVCMESLSVRFLILQLYGAKVYSSTELVAQQQSFFNDCIKYEVSGDEQNTLDSIKQNWGVI